MSRVDVATVLERRLPGRVVRGAPSGPLTTYRCGGPLDVLVHIRSEADLRVVAPVLVDVDVVVIGRGSNLLVADHGFRGVALVLGGDLDRLDLHAARARGAPGRVVAGGAVALPVLARRTAAAGLAGLEFYVGIPGTVGGAVRMNAGGHGRETREVLERARVFSLRDACAREVATDALRLGYRCSAIGTHDVVVEARFAVATDDPAACGRRIDEVVRWRRAHQPGGQNAGSVFTNPPGDAAGRLIDACGCKGLRVGAAVVSSKHANFFVAEPGATAADVVALLRLVQRRVEDATGVRLQPELHLVGFDRDADGGPR